MITLPPRLSLTEAKQLISQPGGAFYGSDRALSAFSELSILPRFNVLDNIPQDTEYLIVAGGGTIIDAAKYWRFEAARNIKLYALPTIWGSGAEASKIAVRNGSSSKDILVNDSCLPNGRIIIPEMSNTISGAPLAFATGDAFSHAIEGFLSPLASDDLRQELSLLINNMLALGLKVDSDWFELSAQACAGQSQSSVGFVHGIAHTLEPIINADDNMPNMGHAQLCTMTLAPVLKFNLSSSDKAASLLDTYGLDQQQIPTFAQDIQKNSSSQGLALKPLIEAHWKQILRNPMTRTNVALVRPSALQIFLDFVAE